MKVFTSKTQQLGQKGEDQAVVYLKNHGFSIIDRNVANKFGEIDVVAKKDKIHYFFEVKAGYKGGFVNPAENLTKEKLRKFLKSVEYYVLINKINNYRAQGIIVLFDRQGSVSVQLRQLVFEDFLFSYAQSAIEMQEALRSSNFLCFGPIEF